ncbi:hypothetical protein CO731_02492 [Aminobacter sp. MSH1]|nr:hypothetical protein CO731_02492 [Aminobacter sp. MSH1]
MLLGTGIACSFGNMARMKCGLKCVTLAMGKF